DADARTDAEQPALPEKPQVAHRGQQFLRDRSRGGAVELRQQHRELVTAQACQRMFAVECAAQRVGDPSQQAVARLVAAGVVDYLELVEIDVQQRGGRAGG